MKGQKHGIICCESDATYRFREYMSTNIVKKYGIFDIPTIITNEVHIYGDTYFLISKLDDIENNHCISINDYIILGNKALIDPYLIDLVKAICQETAWDEEFETKLNNVISVNNGNTIYIDRSSYCIKNDIRPGLYGCNIGDTVIVDIIENGLKTTKIDKIQAIGYGGFYKIGGRAYYPNGECSGNELYGCQRKARKPQKGEIEKYKNLAFRENLLYNLRKVKSEDITEDQAKNIAEILNIKLK